MNLILFDGWCRPHLLPLTYTRPVADLRVGILTIREKWERRLGCTSSTLASSYLQEKFPLQSGADNLLIAGSLLPNDDLLAAIRALQPGEALYNENDLLAFRTNDGLDLRNFFNSYLMNRTTALPMRQVPFAGAYDLVSRPFHIFLLNEKEMEMDFAMLTEGRDSQPISDTNTVIGDRSRIFLEAGASVECSTLNTREGCIYIGRDAEVMEGCRLRGPIALCDHAVLKMDAKVYGATTLGPFCKSGGELANVVFLGYSNKAHDGFLGNSVIGEWCNLGADTNCSNLKNDYANVRLWNYATNKMEETDLQFCGLIMGDHSKCGISTIFNTGTVVGVGCGLFGAGFHPKFIPSFSFGTPGHNYEPFDLHKACDVAARMMARRHKNFDAIEQNLIKKVYEITSYSEK
ncbi:MAG: glucose-1-phosphate thymidylyltransferase [Bacteroidales bacterium]|nr:glucose-1-phosphate thymidylyltransferase [Bacteroidales bacterium]